MIALGRGLGNRRQAADHHPGPVFLVRSEVETAGGRLEVTRRDNAPLFGGDVGQVPREALSMGMATILKAAAIVLIATGERKAACIQRMVRGPLTTRLPASFLQTHRRVELFLDRAAAALLT